MQIQLKSTKVFFLQLAPLYEGSDEVFVSEKKSENIDNFEFELDVRFPEEKKDNFLVIIRADISEKDSFILQTAFVAEFEMAGDDHDAFKESAFPYVNAPAIAYPFFRSFVANTLVNSGYNVMYLPSVNFQEMYNRKKHEMEATETQQL